MSQFPDTQRPVWTLMLGVSRRWLLFGLLGVLHAVLVLGAESPIGRSLLIVHFGLFLLWQPFVGSRLVVPRPYLFLFGLMLVAFVSFGWWALVLWMTLLGGFIGGRVFFTGSLSIRFFYLLALADLISSLLLVAVPMAIPDARGTGGAVTSLSLYVLPLMLGAMMLMLPVHSSDSTPDADLIDLVYSVFVLLLLGVLVAGAIALMLLKKTGYYEALLSTLAVMVTVLLILALVWSPRAGFSGLGALLARYVLAEGLPFDRVLRDLTDLARQEEQAAAFVRRACQLMVTYLVWVGGGRWQLATTPMPEGGEFGRCEGVEHRFIYGGLQLFLYSHRNMSPTLAWHTRMLVQLIGEFAQAKMHAQQLREISYLQAVHETGARLTHDVKNLLQSLNTLCASAEQDENLGSPEFQSLLRRQLPAIAQRLQSTVNKLQKPGQEEDISQTGQFWWGRLRQRFEGDYVSMQATPEALDTEVPATLFDLAAENLIQNAFDKRSLTPALSIAVHFAAEEGLPVMMVEDDGAAVPEATAEVLGQIQLGSENGLGLGLYQIARQARAQGYYLGLLSNVDGQVCFKLAPLPAG